MATAFPGVPVAAAGTAVELEAFFRQVPLLAAAAAHPMCGAGTLPWPTASLSRAVGVEAQVALAAAVVAARLV